MTHDEIVITVDSRVFEALGEAFDMTHVSEHEIEVKLPDEADYDYLRIYEG